MLPANSWHRAAVAQKRLWTAGSAARRYLAPTCAGYLVGRDIRAVEWDAASSPSLPDGRAVSFKLRALTPEGLRIALAKQYRLEGAKDVKQVRSSTEVAATGQQLSEPSLTGTPHTKRLWILAVVLPSGIGSCGWK